MYDVITVGSSTVDVFAKTKTSELIKIYNSSGETNLLVYPTGSKILVEELNFTTGGGATNTAVCLARMGHKVACISKMGTGSNSSKVIRHLKKDKIDTSLMVRNKKGKTGYSIILDSRNHDRTILAFNGSNNDLKYREINLKKVKTKWFYFSTQLEESYNTQVKLAKFAEKNNIKIMFNASEYLVKKGSNFLKEILVRTEILVLNRDEARILCIGNDIRDLMSKIHSLGPKIVVITDGKKSFYVSDGDFLYSGKPNKCTVVETTGAGDAFAATFLSGLLKKDDIEFAIKLASVNSESVIQHHGAKNKLFTYNEAMKQIKKNKLKIKKKKL